MIDCFMYGGFNGEMDWKQTMYSSTQICPCDLLNTCFPIQRCWRKSCLFLIDEVSWTKSTIICGLKTGQASAPAASFTSPNAMEDALPKTKFHSTALWQFSCLAFRTLGCQHALVCFIYMLLDYWMLLLMPWFFQMVSSLQSRLKGVLIC